MKAEGQALFGGTSAGAQADAAAAPGTTPATPSTSKAGSRSTAQATKSTGDAGWAIALEYVSGPDHERTAPQRRIALVRELGRQDISIRSRPDGSVIVLGSYPAAADPKAQADLDAVRTFKRGSALPFARAYLLPPKAEATGAAAAHPEWDLSSVRSTPDGSRFELTLQVAVFDGGGNIQRARRDAESFTQSLRDAGEDAYFFHGPSLSVVTIGLFDAREADAEGRPSSSAARAAQRAHPLNLRDGTTPIPDARGAAQESALMRIP